MFKKLKTLFFDEKGKWKISRPIRTIAIIAILAILAFIFVPLLTGSKNGQENLQTEKLSRGSLIAQVGATGTVHSNQTAMLAWQTSGMIQKINVNLGDNVTKDDILAELDMATVPQTIILAQADLIQAERNLENIKNSNLATAQAQLALANAQDAVNKAKNRVLTYVTRRGSDDMVDSADSQLTIAKGNLKNAEDNFEFFKNKPKDDPNYIQALSMLTSARNALNTAQANYDYVTGKPSNVEVAKNDANYAIALAQLEDAQREYDRLKNGPNADDIAAAQARVDGLKATLAMTHLDAPFNGSVTEINSKVGDLVSPGTISFRIDDLGSMLVDVAVSEIDINRVKLGQDATITFDAILGKTYNGKVTEVARVADITQGVSNFKVTVELTDADESVLPGMTAAVNIVVAKLDDALLIPNRAVRLQDGVRVVYVLRNGIPEIVKITLGLSSDSYSELIDSDLKEGDLIILNPTINFQNFRGGGRGFFGN